MDPTVTHPKISVLMPVYNCAAFVEDAVASILEQTLTNFELIIIDDASTDETVSKVKKFKDSRIQLIEKSVNSGHTNSLIHGVTIANGQYIARMDGDDISLPDRFKKQADFLDAHPDVVLCGSAHVILGTDKIVKRPESHEAIKIELLQKNCFTHPSVMIRNSVLKANQLNYDEAFSVTQDYDFWVRLIPFGTLHNLPDVLLKYRIHDNQVSVKKQDIKPKVRATIRLKMLRYLNAEMDSEAEAVLTKLFERQQDIEVQDIQGFDRIKAKLLNANSSKFYDTRGFEDYLERVQQLMFKDYFLNRMSYSPKVFKQYLKTKSDGTYKLKFRDGLKLFLKSMVFYKNNVK
ncbi:glycosyltransferase [Psychroserpens sp. SPM9]|uniref:glycosyltransferase family 2 protein n=1 Tax=Psychroserpens sp. SPM9 TaxID=2975598 RepID=UPI0021A7DC15|nr:glycosyltransferase [Psychroserpens sp. SPM9]MDG5492244.1 glycosyltransferase [Psychroserpens sp. SPM9]